MAKILITGATGFLGSHLLEEFKGSEHQILAVGRQIKNTVPEFPYWYTDLRDYQATEDMIMDFKPEIIYHLAANSRESTGEHSPIDMTTNGYNTFFNVLTAGIKAGSLKKFIYTSSAAVYGSIRTPYNEGQRPQPHDIYAISKYANELSLKVMAETYDFDYVIVRPHNITGERQDPRDPSRNVVPMFMQLLRLGKQPKIYGDGSSVRCYTYVKDVARALHDCMDLSNVIMNVGSDTPTTIQELYDTIVEVSGIEKEPEYAPARPNEVRVNTVSHENIKKYLPSNPMTPFKETIQKTWDWVSKQPLKNFKPLKKEIEL